MRSRRVHLCLLDAPVIDDTTHLLCVDEIWASLGSCKPRRFTIILHVIDGVARNARVNLISALDHSNCQITVCTAMLLIMITTLSQAYMFLWAAYRKSSFKCTPGFILSNCSYITRSCINFKSYRAAVKSFQLQIHRRFAFKSIDRIVPQGIEYYPPGSHRIQSCWNFR